MLLKWISLLCILSPSFALSSDKPNIILIIADDLGWNDVGFHGSNEIPTPNIDALAYNGVILNRHYVPPTCTPSRSALMTGKYPFKLGMQGSPIIPSIPIGLPLKEKIIPQHLKKLGYVSRLVGKWHLGFYKYDFTPLKRGFDSHFGYYNGWIRYNDSVITTKSKWGYDARNDFEHAGDRFRGKYATDVFTEEALDIIKNHDTSKPLFLDVSHAAVHAAAFNTLMVRNPEENEKRFGYIKNPRRRLLAGVLTAFDESVGKIVAALNEKKMLENSIVMVISDNGGSTLDTDTNFTNSASNWPLRGWKASLTEGGVRGVAALWSPATITNTVSDQLFHITDWLPTFYAAAGGDVTDLGAIDGTNHWPYLTGQRSSSPRNQVVLNINEETNDTALIIDDWKYIRINSEASIDYKGANGRDIEYTYNLTQVISSQTHKILSKLTASKTPSTGTPERFIELRQQSSIEEYCRERIQIVDNTEYNSKLRCFQTGCLFNIKNDPCEFNDLSQNEPSLMDKFQVQLNAYQQQLVPQLVADPDPNCDPSQWDHYWTPWIVDDDQGTSDSASLLPFKLIILATALYALFILVKRRYKKY